MSVDGGSGNPISLSEIQSFYGGSNPISLSEYYRNGGEVPGQLVSAQSETSGSTSQTIGQFSVGVSSGYSGSLIVPGSISSYAGPGSAVAPYTVTAADALVTGVGGGANDDSSPRVTVQVTRSGSVIFNQTRDPGVGSATSISLRGPVYSGSGLSTSYTTQLQAGDIFRVTSFSGESPEYGYIYISRRNQQHDVTFTNNSGSTITTTSGSTGGAQSYTSGQSRTVKDDSSSASYTLGYSAVNGNTNVPTSGQINMNVFNAPGDAAP
jgi:hypothetical protein